MSKVLRIRVLTGILVGFWLETATAEIVMNANAGYLTGSFSPKDTFVLSGSGFRIDGGYQYTAPTYMLYLGVGSGYAQATYETNGVIKFGKVYYGGVYGAAGIGDQYRLQLKVGVSPLAKFFVFSNTSLDVNDDPSDVDEYSMYSGGLGLDFSLGLLRRFTASRKNGVMTLFGIELGGLQQTFTQHRQRTVIDRSTGEDTDASEETSGSYFLSIMMLSLLAGVEF